MRLAGDIYDRKGVLLLTAGTTITPEFLDLLRSRMIRFVRIDEDSVSSVAGPSDDAGSQSARTDHALATESAGRRLPRAEFRKLVMQGLARHEAARDDIAAAFGALRDGGVVSEREITRFVGEFADMVALDADLVPTILSLQSAPDEYLYHHSVNVAVLSISLGAQLGLTRDSMTMLGLGALLHDVGMLQVPDSIRLAPRPLTPDEWVIVRRHPNYTRDYVDRISGLPRGARLVCCQVHERCDRRGYPAGLSGMTIHPHAKIAAVADTYVAMTRRRPYRDALAPYDAARVILEDCSAGRFDTRAVRALLDSLSLYPIGSTVRLDDGTPARVVRANPGLHTRPIVETLNSDERLIDLSKETDRSIVHVGKPSPPAASGAADRSKKPGNPASPVVA